MRFVVVSIVMIYLIGASGCGGSGTAEIPTKTIPFTPDMLVKPGGGKGQGLTIDKKKPILKAN